MKCRGCYKKITITENDDDDDENETLPTLSISKFSIENGMIPANIPEELQGLSWLEQIAISHLIPVQTIYYLKYNGATASKGHCVFIPNNVQRISNVLPNMDCNVIVSNIIP